MKVNNHYALSTGPSNSLSFHLSPGKNIRNNATAFKMEEAYLAAYALYLSKFVHAYQEEGVTIIPAAPGYIGTFDASGIAVLVAYGVDQAVATGYTLVLHVALWLPITVVGAIFMTREGIKWRDSLRTEKDIG